MILDLVEFLLFIQDQIAKKTWNKYRPLNNISQCKAEALTLLRMINTSIFLQSDFKKKQINTWQALQEML